MTASWTSNPLRWPAPEPVYGIFGNSGSEKERKMIDEALTACRWERLQSRPDAQMCRGSWFITKCENMDCYRQHYRGG